MTALIFLGLGPLLLLAGYLIKYKGMFRILAGYQRGKDAYDAAFARRVGNRFLFAGALAMTTGLIGLLYFRGQELFLIMVYLAILIGTAMYSDLLTSGKRSAREE